MQTQYSPHPRKRVVKKQTAQFTKHSHLSWPPFSIKRIKDMTEAERHSPVCGLIEEPQRAVRR